MIWWHSNSKWVNWILPIAITSFLCTSAADGRRAILFRRASRVVSSLLRRSRAAACWWKPRPDERRVRTVMHVPRILQRVLSIILSPYGLLNLKFSNCGMFGILISMFSFHYEEFCNIGQVALNLSKSRNV